MADFYKFLPKLLSLEGGYQNHSKDTGNYNSNGDLVGTKYGIAAKTYEQYLKRPPSIDEMKSITKTIAGVIYKKGYWQKLKASIINNQNVAEIIVDHGVNAGTSRAAKLVQKALNTYFNATLKVDGIIGSKTVEAINSVNGLQLFEKLKNERKNYYLSLNNSTFITGWLNRLNTFVISKAVNLYNDPDLKKKVKPLQ